MGQPMSKIQGLEHWDLSTIAADAQVAAVSVFVSYPKISPQLIALAPAERPQFITQNMREAINLVLETNRLTNWKFLKTSGRRGRCYEISGEVRMADISKLAELSVVEFVRVEATKGKKKRPSKPKRKPTFFCVKMTVAIQIEGRKQGMQSYEERYVLYRGHSEDEVIKRAQIDVLAYQEPYLNSDGLLVRWQVESIDSAYEVVTEPNAKGLEGAEVFSVLKTRKLNPARVWTENEKIDEV
jgi:hypothetical protein